MERVQSLDFPDGTYFFEQTNLRKTPKRQRKRPEDLPKVNNMMYLQRSICLEIIGLIAVKK